MLEKLSPIKVYILMIQYVSPLDGHCAGAHPIFVYFDEKDAEKRRKELEQDNMVDAAFVVEECWTVGSTELQETIYRIERGDL